MKSTSIRDSTLNQQCGVYPLIDAYRKPLPVTEAKKVDDIYLLKKTIIPAEYEYYTESMPAGKVINYCDGKDN